MKWLSGRGFILLTIILMIVGVSSSAFGQLEIKPEYFVVNDFKLQSGEVLKEMKVEYGTLGKPKTNASGEIVNGVIFAHGGSGNYAQIKLLKSIVGPGKPFDTERFFFICPTALGFPNSSSPSTSGLGPDFPKYTIGDMVAAQYLLVTKHLKIKHLAGVTGPSMGGMQTLQWITQYPDFMDWAIPIATAAAWRGRNVGIWGLMNYVIMSDPAYKDGHYTEQPKKGLELGFMGTYLWYFTPKFFLAKFKTNEALLKGLKDIGLGSAKADANNIIWRNDAMFSFDVAAELPKVKARTLVIGVNSDEIFPPDTGFIPVSKAIPGAKLFAYDSVLGHLGCAIHINKASQAIVDFLK